MKGLCIRLLLLLHVFITIFFDISPANADVFNQAQRSEIEKLIKQYLIENPEIVVQALEEMRQRQQKLEDERVRLEIKRHSADLFSSATSPILGNNSGKINLVFFFDYQCTYCKQIAGTLIDRLKQERDVKLIMKELPILGPESFMMAQAALAARKQGKYEAFHMALMASRSRLSSEQVQKIAEGLGLNLKQLSQDMQSLEVLQELDKNRSLATILNIHGTPAFIVGSQLVVGAPEPDDLIKALKELARPVNR